MRKDPVLRSRRPVFKQGQSVDVQPGARASFWRAEIGARPALVASLIRSRAKPLHMPLFGCNQNVGTTPLNQAGVAVRYRTRMLFYVEFHQAYIIRDFIAQPTVLKRRTETSSARQRWMFIARLRQAHIDRNIASQKPSQLGLRPESDGSSWRRNDVSLDIWANKGLYSLTNAQFALAG
jgi:hypothetical protein